MNKTVTMATIMMVVLAAAGGAKGTIVNGSFEDDGLIEDIGVEEPNGWDVNLPDPAKFGGYVDYEWATEGTYNLTLYSVYYGNFQPNDIVTVSQPVYMAEVNEIVFDLKLESYYNLAWDPNEITAVLLIDNDVVWESNSVGADVRDEYPGQVYDVNDMYKDGTHVLSLGLRVNVAEQLRDYYKAQWDFVEATLVCDGLGLVPGDVTRDCYVDANDVRDLTGVWLQEVGVGSRYNLYDDDPNGLVNMRDYAVLADHWLESSYD